MKSKLNTRAIKCSVAAWHRTTLQGTAQQQYLVVGFNKCLLHCGDLVAILCYVIHHVYGVFNEQRVVGLRMRWKPPTGFHVETEASISRREAVLPTQQIFTKGYQELNGMAKPLFAHKKAKLQIIECLTQ